MMGRTMRPEDVRLRIKRQAELVRAAAGSEDELFALIQEMELRRAAAGNHVRPGMRGAWRTSRCTEGRLSTLIWCVYYFKGVSAASRIPIP